MASSSTRSVFNLSFAKENNIADITAKSTSQWIFSSLLGTAAGVCVCVWGLVSGVQGRQARFTARPTSFPWPTYLRTGVTMCAV